MASSVLSAVVDAANAAQLTALHLAAQQCCEEALSLLLDREASPAAVDGSGHTALHFVCGARRVDDPRLRLRCAKRLLGAGADASAAAHDGTTPLHLLAEVGDAACAEYLLGAGARVVPNRAGDTPLHVAALYGRLDCMKCLVLYGHAGPAHALLAKGAADGEASFSPKAIVGDYYPDQDEGATLSTAAASYEDGYVDDDGGVHLQGGWIRYTLDTGEEYWYEPSTGTSQWTPPEVGDEDEWAPTTEEPEKAKKKPRAKTSPPPRQWFPSLAADRDRAEAAARETQQAPSSSFSVPHEGTTTAMSSWDTSTDAEDATTSSLGGVDVSPARALSHFEADESPLRPPRRTYGPSTSPDDAEVDDFHARGYHRSQFGHGSPTDGDFEGGPDPRYDDDLAPLDEEQPDFQQQGLDDNDDDNDADADADAAPVNPDDIDELERRYDGPRPPPPPPRIVPRKQSDETPYDSRPPGAAASGEEDAVMPPERPEDEATEESNVELHFSSSEDERSTTRGDPFAVAQQAVGPNAATTTTNNNTGTDVDSNTDDDASTLVHERHLAIWTRFLENAAKRSADVGPPMEEHHGTADGAARRSVERTREVELRDAAAGGDVERARQLLEEGGVAPGRGDGDRRTAMHFAAYANSLAVARLLYDCGSDVASKDFGGNEPLHVAAARGAVDVLVFLLGCAAPVANPNSDGDRPLHLAAWMAYPDCVEALLQAGAPVDATNDADLDALDNILERSPIIAKHHARTLKASGANGKKRPKKLPEGLTRSIAILQAARDATKSKNHRHHQKTPLPPPPPP